MAERIDMPFMPAGRAEDQIQYLYRYLYRMAETLNINMAEVGDAALTDEEQLLMNQLSGKLVTSQTEQFVPEGYGQRDQETLKSLIIKTAEYMKTQLDQYQMILFGETEGAGPNGTYRQRKGLRVDVTPDGIKQTYTYAEIVKGLRTYEINAKNYIKTGFLRTESSIPIYGVAIGRDVVTFSEDGTETYNDGNKVAELTADELSFYQSGKKLASYKGNEIVFYINNTAKLKINGDGITFLNGTTKLAEMLETALKFYYAGALRSQMDNEGVSFWNGSTKLADLKGTELTFYQNGNNAMKITGDRIGFYNNGTEYMYITGGKVYTTDDLHIGSGKNVYIGDWRFNSNGLIYYAGSTPRLQFGRDEDRLSGVESGVFVGKYNTGYDYTSTPYIRFVINSGDPDANVILDQYDLVTQSLSPGQDELVHLGKPSYRYATAYIKSVHYNSLVQESSRDVKHDIQPMENQGDRLDQLQPVTFVYDEDREERKRYGLIYEDTEEIMPDICTGDESNKAINYVELIPMMLKEIQDLRARVRALEERTGG